MHYSADLNQKLFRGRIICELKLDILDPIFPPLILYHSCFARSWTIHKLFYLRKYITSFLRNLTIHKLMSVCLKSWPTVVRLPSLFGTIWSVSPVNMLLLYKYKLTSAFHHFMYRSNGSFGRTTEVDEYLIKNEGSELKKWLAWQWVHADNSHEAKMWGQR